MVANIVGSVEFQDVGPEQQEPVQFEKWCSKALQWRCSSARHPCPNTVQ